MDDITQAIVGLTQRITAYRAFCQTERKLKMSRLTDKLQQAGGVVDRVSQAIEADADAVIALEAEVHAKRKEAFSGHFANLQDAKQGLEDLKRKLELLGNAPVDASKVSPIASMTLEEYLATNKITPEAHVAAVTAGFIPDSRTYFEFVSQFQKPQEEPVAVG